MSTNPNLALAREIIDMVPAQAYVATIPPAIRRKWDALAVPQLLGEIARLHSENQHLQRADADADYWHQNYMALEDTLTNERDLDPAITQSGQVVFIPRTPSPAADAPSSASADQAAPTVVLRSGERGKRPSFPFECEGPLDNCVAVSGLTGHHDY